MSDRDAKLSKKRGIRVKDLLKEYHMTQTQLSDEIKVSKEHLNAILNGKRTLTLEHAVSIANLFNVRFEWIMCFDDYRTQEDLIFAAMGANSERRKLIEHLMALSGYVHKENTGPAICSRIERIYLEYPPGISDEEIVARAHQKEEHREPLITIISPDKKEVHMNHAEYVKVINDIASYVDMRMSFLFQGQVNETDFWERIFGKYGRGNNG